VCVPGWHADMAALRLRESAVAGPSQLPVPRSPAPRRPYSEYALETDLASELERIEAHEAAATGGVLAFFGGEGGNEACSREKELPVLFCSWCSR
jgi:hypothetical protein